MANNHDIRCGMLMKIELNKNYIEEYIEENYNKVIQYDCCNENKIDAFWRELNQNCVRIFEAPQLYPTPELQMEEIFNRLELLAYDYDFDIQDKEEEVVRKITIRVKGIKKSNRKNTICLKK